MLKATFRLALRRARRLVVAGTVAYVARLVLVRWVDGPEPIAGDPRWAAPDGPAPVVPAPAAAGTSVQPAEEARAAAGTWVPPAEDGSTPDSHPVKVKLSSGIYHLPGGATYGRTHPDRCYASAEAAAADGFVPAKR